MSDKTCAYCDHHNWSDTKWEHICLLAGGDGGEMSCSGSCDRFKPSRQGRYNVTGHTCIYDMADVESRVPDDKYTRGDK